MGTCVCVSACATMPRHAQNTKIYEKMVVSAFGRVLFVDGAEYLIERLHGCCVSEQ